MDEPSFPQPDKAKEQVTIIKDELQASPRSVKTDKVKAKDDASLPIKKYKKSAVKVKKDETSSTEAKQDGTSRPDQILKVLKVKEEDSQTLETILRLHIKTNQGFKRFETIFRLVQWGNIHNLEAEVCTAIMDGQKGLPVKEKLTIEQAQSHLDTARLGAYNAMWRCGERHLSVQSVEFMTFLFLYRKLGKYPTPSRRFAY